MHFHRLAFGAIGPFAGQHVIDFDGLGGSALFLIDGPTGAGKSTIIDAIVFALFGDVAGSGSDRQRLRSSFAGPGEESYAELDFTTSFGRYRVRRTPEYERAKVRGTGTTRAASSVALLRSTGPDGWEAVSTRQGDADAEIARIVGLNRVQFLQTVVLPQGEFATFLAAESKDRQAVLERIFATSLYSRIETALEEARRVAQVARESAAADVDRAIQHVHSRLPDVDRADLAAETDSAVDAETVVSILTAIVEAVAIRLEDETAGLGTVMAVLDSTTLRVLDLEACARARLRVESADVVVRAALDARAAARVGLAAYAVTIASLGVGDVDAQVAAIDRVTGSLGAAVEAERRLHQDADSLHRLQDRRLRIEASIGELETERDHALPALMRGLATALSDALDEAVEGATLASAQEAHLIQARLDGMAAELAAGLVDGTACAVCGAEHHPAPAEPTGEAVTPSDLAAAARARVDADARRHARELEQERLAAVAVDLAAVAVPEAAVLLPRADEIAAGVRDLQHRISAVDEGLSRGREDRTALDAEATALRAAMDERTDVVAGALAGHASIGERLAELADARVGLVAALDADQEVVRRQQAHQEACDALAVLGAEPGAGEVELEALQGQRTALEAQVHSLRSRRDATSELLADLRTRVELAEQSVVAREECWRDTADVISLANVVKGGVGNTLAQPLSSFVVQTMFDEILESANRRLRTMLDGRFELQSTEGRTSRRLMGLGLGLEVLDLRTDSVRRTSTLSGGETFCASLALALGLADTVRAHAGGVEIGMLLIDEGFGSLDADRLDEVMAELLRLRADGRSVGVISHVTEMKRSIPERIDVRPLGARLGSTLDVSWTD